MLWVRISIRVRCTTYVIMFVSDLWFSLGSLVSSTNKTDRHDITEILLKVVLNTINHTHHLYLSTRKIILHFSSTEEQEVVPPPRATPISDKTRPTLPKSIKKNDCCVWDIHDNFHITLHTACNVQVPENYKNVVSILKISLFVLWKLNFFTALSDIEQNYMLCK